LGVRRSRRTRELLAAIAATGGTGHVASATDVASARLLLEADGIDVSDESAANVAVARRIADQLDAAPGTVCCLVSGSPAAASGHVPPSIEATDEHAALAAVAERLGISPRSAR
ncbi:MAG: hypothetical protein JWO69_706, partial [Thermoleophilia bacterium]|nr:hypothetical protein [Thermoleophilia bacterium]